MENFYKISFSSKNESSKSVDEDSFWKISFKHVEAAKRKSSTENPKKSKKKKEIQVNKVIKMKKATVYVLFARSL